MREWFRQLPKFSLVGGLAAGLVVLLFVFTLAQLSNVEKRDCEHIELIKDRIRLVIGQSLKTLGKPGGAGYEYYLTHPVELVHARAGLQQELVQFAPDRC